MKPNEIQTSDHHPKISIGLPVYNGEKFIRKKLESLLMQTFKDFEIIISDNASTDSTSHICEEFSKKDNRIRYIRQENHLIALENYYFVLREAKYEYFVWTAVDDIMLPEFLEKNVSVLLSNKNVVCSISKMRLYGETTEYLKSNKNNSILTNAIKKIKLDLGYMDTYSASGSYETKVMTYLKHLRHNQIFYGIYRTEQIRKCIVKESFLGVEGTIILNLIKYGDLHVVNEVLLEVYDGGMSRSGMIDVTRELNHGLLGMIFPFYHFTLWCAKNLGIKVFLRKFYFFFKINLDGVISMLIDIVRRFLA
jgi:glycosyltransferase involved in cell wall biosynthesis